MCSQAAPSPYVTPIIESHRALGARLVEFGGWLMPLQYRGILDEHRAVRTVAGLFDLSHMGEIFVEGSGAGNALAFALVSDPRRLAVGRAHYTMICRPDGRIIDDLIVYRLGPERYMVAPNASNAQAVSVALAERLDGFAAILDDETFSTFPWPAEARGSTEVRAHEFHYASLENLAAETRFAYRIRRGHGIDGERDGIMMKNVLASFVHRRSTERDHWAARFVAFIRASGYPQRRARNPAGTGTAPEREVPVV